MNKEERLNDYIKGYKSQYQLISEDKIEHTLDKDIKDLLKENKQLKDNWNKLKEWIQKNKQWQVISERSIVWEDKLTNKIQELEDK